MTGQRLNAKLLRERRIAKGWTVSHLADAAGLNERTVRRAEARESVAGETRLAIAAALDVSAEALLDGTNSGHQLSARRSRARTEKERRRP